MIPQCTEHASTAQRQLIASLLVNARTFARPLPSDEIYVQHPTSSDFREGEEIAKLGRNASLEA